ncbi:MAG: type II secretion system protein [Minisyncoccia bacterium]
MESFHLLPSRRGFTQPLTVSAGFTLVELLVVLAIITSITAVVFSSQSTFNKTLILANTAYDVALSLRSVETHGIGGRAISVYPTGYGIHLDHGAPGSFILFADVYPLPSLASVCHPTTDMSAPDAQPGNCKYDSSNGEWVSATTLGNNITISDFCAYPPAPQGKLCTNLGNLTSLDIVFARPNPDPLISPNGTFIAGTTACLTLSSAQGGSRSVSVLASGQITTSASPCL